jgi:hypothetical protein
MRSLNVELELVPRQDHGRIETHRLPFFSYVLGFATTTGVSHGLGGIIGGLENLSV